MTNAKLDPSLLMDNAACASQCSELLDDHPTRQAVLLNVYRPLWDEIERLDADAAGVQAELASVKLENERLQGLVDGAYNRGFAVGSGNEGHYQREIARLRAALQRIVSEGDYTAPEGMKRIARAAIDGDADEPGAVAMRPPPGTKALSDMEHAWVYDATRHDPKLYSLIRRLVQYGVEQDPPCMFDGPAVKSNPPHWSERPCGCVQGESCPKCF